MTETYQTIDNDFANTAPVEAIDSEIAALESKIEGKAPASKVPPEKSAAASEEALREELGKIYDALQAKGEAEAQAKTVSMPKAETLEAAFQATADWMATPESEKAQMADVRNEVQKVKDNAAKFGVQIDDAKALEIALQMEQQQAGKAAATPPEYEAIRQSYPGLQPQQVVSRWNEIDNYVKRSPAEGAAWIYQQTTGQSPLELARQIAAQHSPVEHQHYYAQRDLMGYIDGFLASHPDANQEAILQAIGKIQRTGDVRKDFVTAYEVSKGLTPKSGKRRSADARMRDTRGIADFSAGERDVSGVACAQRRTGRRSTGSDYRRHDCRPGCFLSNSTPRTSDTGSPNTHYPCQG
jgi:hypothetical protein